MMALKFNSWMEKPCCRRNTPLVIGGTQTQVPVNSIAIAASVLNHFAPPNCTDILYYVMLVLNPKGNSRNLINAFFIYITCVMLARYTLSISGSLFKCFLAL